MMMMMTTTMTIFEECGLKRDVEAVRSLLNLSLRTPINIIINITINIIIVVVIIIIIIIVSLIVITININISCIIIVIIIMCYGWKIEACLNVFISFFWGIFSCLSNNIVYLSLSLLSSLSRES